MTETTIDGAIYAIGTLSAKKQIHVAKRLTPFLAAILPHVAELRDSKLSVMERIQLVFPDLAGMISKLSDEDSDFVIDTCLSVVKLKQETGWANLMNSAGGYQFPLTALAMLQLTAEVVQENLAGFFPTASPEVSAESPTV
jgi:hypothetical protein